MHAGGSEMKIRTIIYKVFGIVNCLALLLVMQSANSACTFYYHQPNFPKSADKFKRIK